jgi:exopolyphosphatase/pppGpp-phosphohydrolase
MVCGCIDIGSNTTRVLVADTSDGRLRELLQRRAFTRIGKGLKPGAEIPRAKIEEVAGVVASHRRLAEQVGADHVRTVATAAIRCAANRDEFVEVVSEQGGVEVTILEGEEEARLAFLGATRTDTRSRASSAWSTSAAARPSWPSARSMTGSHGGPRSGSARATSPTSTCARTRRPPRSCVR